jgi:thiamine-phosphate pyrophosphorylase
MIILISPENSFEDEVNLVNLMFKLGLDRYHLRRPDLDQRGHLLDLKMFSRGRFGQISVHGGLPKGRIHKRVGLHKKSLNPWEVLDSASLSSVSLHDELEIENDLSKVDYAVVSPVFNSISKSEYLSKYSVEKWKEINKKRKITQPKSILLALGGIDESKLKEVYDMGFDGIALKGVVWGHRDPLVAYTKISNAWWKIIEENK